MNWMQILGMVAGACTSAAVVPQLVKTWQTKEADGVSVAMFALYLIGFSLWLGYGIIQQDLPIILSNLISIFFNLVMLFFKFRYQKRSQGLSVV
jgi:MtN3 and saliva related transmembrane protein